jgi:putative thiamine transport system permease protein
MTPPALAGAREGGDATARADAPADRRSARRLAGALLLPLTLGLPVAAGLAGVLAPAFGYLPAIGGRTLTLEPWRDLLGWPGLGRAVAVALGSGMLAVALSFLLAMAVCACLSGSRAFLWVTRALSPLLAAPHAAAAFGLAFLIAPSGWVARALSPWATGWARPPDWLIVNDPLGLALTAGLALKETPFLLLMTLAALPQADAARAALTARALGRGPAAAWVAAALPRVYPQIRLPVYAALAYGVSAVDMALILGPTAPPTLAVQTLLWANDPDLSRRFTAAAAATLQIGLAGFVIGLWRLGEMAAARVGRRWIEAGGRGGGEAPLRAAALAGAALVAGTAALGLAALAAWSVAGLWTFPHVLPDALTLRHWAGAAPGLWPAAGATLAVGLASTALGLALAIGALAAGARLWLVWVPLLAPQTAFLMGLQTLLLSAGAVEGAGAVIAAHAVFVAPYVALSLAEPWRALDPRLALAARALGAGAARVFWAVRLPMLLRAVLTAAAVGFAVSAGLYLPTVLAGGGRVATLATEAVALSAGGDRRLIGVHALALTAMAFAGFALAQAVPALLFRNRRGLRP